MEVQENALHKQLMSYREQEIEMEQKTLLLRKQVLQNRYELQRISDSYALSPRRVPHGHQEQGGTGGGAAGVRVQDPCGGTGTGELAARLGGYHRAPFAHSQRPGTGNPEIRAGEGQAGVARGCARPSRGS